MPRSELDGCIDKRNIGAVVLEAAVVWAVLFAVLQGLFDGIFFSIFQLRDIDRARSLVQGHPIFFGPEMTGGGHLPGGFYYFLLAPAVAIGGWRAAWQWELVLLAAGGAWAWLFARRRFGVLPASLVLLSALTSQPTISAAGEFSNPSFIPLFVVSALILLCEAFGGPARGTRSAWRAFCLVCGVGIQLHATFLFILLSGIALQVCADRLDLPPLESADCLGGLIFFLIPLLPYGFWLACKKASIHVGQPDLPFTGTDQIVLRCFLKTRLSQIHPSDVRQCVRGLLNLMPTGSWIALLLIGAARSVAGPQTETVDPSASERRFSRNCSKILAVATAFAFLPCLIPVLADLRGMRYTACFTWPVSLLIGALAARRGRGFAFASGAGILAFAFAEAWGYRSAAHSLGANGFFWSVAGGVVLAALVCSKRRADPPLRLFPVIAALPLLIALGIASSAELDPGGLTPRTIAAVARRIREQTGWTYAEMRLRTVDVNIQKEWSPGLVYREVEAEQLGRGERKDEGIDGYFLGLSSQPMQGSRSVAAQPWPLGEDIDDAVSAGIRDGGIKLGLFFQYDGMNLVPYKIRDLERFPTHFHNRSDGYSLDASGLEPGEPNGESRRLTFNDCPWKDPVYDIVAEVRIAALGRGRWKVRIDWDGEPISQSSAWASPDWTERILNPYFGYSCGGAAKRIALAESIGFDNQAWLSGRGLLAPFERDFHVSCGGALGNPSVGYESVEAYSRDMSRSKLLPGKAGFIRM